jgi:hypothetical protein
MEKRPKSEGVKWFAEAVAAEALKYETRNDFMQGSRSAYNAAHRLKIMDAVTAHMRPGGIKWTPENLAEEAAKYSSRVEFQEQSRGAYLAARRYGIVDELTKHMRRRTQRWFRDTIPQEAAKYSTRLAFARGTPGAYHAAADLGILDEVCSHMEYCISTTDRDAIYIWHAIDFSEDDYNVYKIGITSKRLRAKRIAECASIMGTRYRLVKLKPITYDAQKAEKYLFQLFTTVPHNVPKRQGHTEFRVLTNDELALACALIELLTFMGE